MTQKEKELAKLLFQKDHYLVGSANARGKEVYKVMKGNQVPVQYFSEKTFRKFSDILKSDGKQRFTLNLSEVRKLNGNSLLKKMYKENKK